MNTSNILTLNNRNGRILSGSSLKIIAIVLMFIDHFGAAILYYCYLLPTSPFSYDALPFDVLTLYKIMRFVGRSAFPIFCFLLVQGFIHTANRQKYALRLFLFALISELPFDLALQNSLNDLHHQNVFFTLFIGFCVIWAMDMKPQQIVYQLLILALGAGLAYFLKTDYSYWGILLISALYFFRYHPGLQTLAGCVCLFWEAPACLAFLPINLYNNKRGISLKYFFYLFYPGHLLLLAALRYFYMRS